MANLGKIYVYNGINDTNYDSAGHFHPVKRPDAKFIISAKKTDEDQETTVSLQVCLDDTAVEANWTYVQQDIEVPSDPQNGCIINSSIEGVTGIRIVPADDNTTFSLSVLEYFPPGKISCLGPDNFLVT
jgi:hypothetical protein